MGFEGIVGFGGNSQNLREIQGSGKMGIPRIWGLAEFQGLRKQECPDLGEFLGFGRVQDLGGFQHLGKWEFPGFGGNSWDLGEILGYGGISVNGGNPGILGPFLGYEAIPRIWGFGI